MTEHLHQPRAPSGSGLVLTHGAGGNARAPLLVALGEAFAERGVTVVRYDLPYRQASRTAPPRPAGAARDREGLREAVASMRASVSGRVFLGGHSYGGRQASILAASEPGLADMLLLLSYPLHPPRRPAELRTVHLPNLKTPTHPRGDRGGATSDTGSHRAGHVRESGARPLSHTRARRHGRRR